MAYCSVGDIVQHYRLIEFNGESKPSRNEVEVFCTDVSTDLDAFLRTLDVSLPLTDSEHISIMKTTAEYGVLATVMRSTGKQEEAEQWEELFQARRKMLIDNPDLVRETEGTIDEPRFKTAAKRTFRVAEKDW